MQQLNDIVYGMIEEAHTSLDRLKQIALKPNPMTEVEYIDLLIKSEKREAKPGYMQRVTALQEIRKQAELLEKVENENTRLSTGTGKKGWRDMWGLLR